MVDVLLSLTFYTRGARLAMSNEELTVRIQAGDIGLLPAPWEQVERFIAQRAGRRVRSMNGYGGIEAEDLYHAGYFAVLEAVKRFDTQRARRSSTSWYSSCGVSLTAPWGGIPPGVTRWTGPRP